MKKVNLVYFQHDLRIHDHPGLTAASQHGLPIIGVYLFNPIELENTAFGFQRMGLFRLQFLYESLRDLKDNLAKLNIPLFVFNRETTLAANVLKSAYEIHAIYAAVEPGRDEQVLLKAFQFELSVTTLVLHHDKALISPSDYPWLLKQLPGRFTDARIKIEASIHVRPLIS